MNLSWKIRPGCKALPTINVDTNGTNTGNQHTGPTHGTNTRNQHTEPARGTNTQDQHTEPTHGTNERNKDTDPTHGTSTRDQHTEPTHGTRNVHVHVHAQAYAQAHTQAYAQARAHTHNLWPSLTWTECLKTPRRTGHAVAPFLTFTNFQNVRVNGKKTSAISNNFHTCCLNRF